MSAYYRASVREFLQQTDTAIVGELARNHTGTTPEQLKSWEREVIFLQRALTGAAIQDPHVSEWAVLLEYRMFRLQRRIDGIILAGDAILVVEFKIGSNDFDAAAVRQVEDYALDLHDF